MKRDNIYRLANDYANRKAQAIMEKYELALLKKDEEIRMLYSNVARLRKRLGEKV